MCCETSYYQSRKDRTIPDLKDFLPPLPKSLFRQKRFWIESLTENELVRALISGDAKITDIPEEWKGTPKYEAIVTEYLEKKAEIENPEIYWDKVISNIKERLAEALESKRLRKPPGWTKI